MYRFLSIILTRSPGSSIHFAEYFYLFNLFFIQFTNMSFLFESHDFLAQPLHDLFLQTGNIGLGNAEKIRHPF